MFDENEYEIICHFSDDGTTAFLVSPERFAIGVQKAMKSACKDLPQECKMVLLDFKHTRVIDSLGMRVLLDTQEFLQEEGRSFEIINVSGDVGRLLKVVNLDKALTMRFS